MEAEEFADNVAQPIEVPWVDITIKVPDGGVLTGRVSFEGLEFGEKDEPKLEMSLHQRELWGTSGSRVNREPVFSCSEVFLRLRGKFVPDQAGVLYRVESGEGEQR